MAAHGVEGARSEVFFHPAAGSTDAGGLQYCLADLKRLMLEGKEVDSVNDQVASGPSGIDFWFTEDVSKHLQVFLLNQGDLTFFRKYFRGISLPPAPNPDQSRRISIR